MNTEPVNELDSLRASLAALKREAAKAIAGAQLGGDRRKRRELSRQLEACRRKARSLSRKVNEVSDAPGEAGEETRAELAQASKFLMQLQEMGNVTGGDQR